VNNEEGGGGKEVLDPKLEDSLGCKAAVKKEKMRGW
jgi:hypothetical protein